MVIGRAIGKGEAFLGKRSAGEGYCLRGVLAVRAMDVENGVSRRIHRLTGRGIGLKTAARRRVADREVVSVANADAERPIGEGSRRPRPAWVRLEGLPEGRCTGREPIELIALSSIGIVAISRR